MTAQAARFGSQDTRTLHAAVRSVEDAGREALRSMRGVVLVLREDDDDPLPLTTTRWRHELQALDDQHAVQTGVPVRVDADAVDLAAGHRQAVLRIAREALTNVRRHAREPREVYLRLSHDEHILHLVVTDDGRGGAGRGVGFRQTGTGFGLIGMRERAEVLGGTLRAGSDAVLGWRVQADLRLVLERRLEAR